MKDNSIVIFKNNRKSADTHPEYTGKLKVDGIVKDISLWVKEGAKGKFFAGNIKEEWKPNNAPVIPDNTPAKEGTEKGIDEDLSF